MNQTITAPSSAWVSFTYVNFAMSGGLTLVGLLYAPMDIWMKGYFLMGISMLISATAILSKTLRDSAEAGKLHNKIEDAKTEQLLMRIDRTKD